MQKVLQYFGMKKEELPIDLKMDLFVTYENTNQCYHETLGKERNPHFSSVPLKTHNIREEDLHIEVDIEDFNFSFHKSTGFRLSKTVFYFCDNKQMELIHTVQFVKDTMHFYVEGICKQYHPFVLKKTEGKMEKFFALANTIQTALQKIRTSSPLTSFESYKTMFQSAFPVIRENAIPLSTILKLTPYDFEEHVKFSEKEDLTEHIYSIYRTGRSCSIGITQNEFCSIDPTKLISFEGSSLQYIPPEFCKKTKLYYLYFHNKKMCFHSMEKALEYAKKELPDLPLVTFWIYTEDFYEQYVNL